MGQTDSKSAVKSIQYLLSEVSLETFQGFMIFC